MKPVTQTILSSGTDSKGILLGPPGNCWAACVASLLEVGLDNLPKREDYWKPRQMADESWTPFYHAMSKVLFEDYGLAIVEVRAKYLCSTDYIEDLYYIASGKSPREGLHACIGKGIQILHDPHPSRLGLKDEFLNWTVEYLVKINPISPSHFMEQ